MTKGTGQDLKLTVMTYMDLSMCWIYSNQGNLSVSNNIYESGIILCMYPANEQSGTKPNFVAKILATKCGVFLLYISSLKKYVQYESNDNVIK